MSAKQSILEQLDSVVGTDGKRTSSNAEEVYVKNLPDNITAEQVNSLRKYDGEFEAAIFERHLPDLVNDMVVDQKRGIALMEAYVLGTSYGAVLTRPVQENPTEEHYTDAICLYTSTVTTSDVGSVMERHGVMWSNASKK